MNLNKFIGKVIEVPIIFCDVGLWEKIDFDLLFSFHFHNISVELVFSSQEITKGKMVYLLEPVKLLSNEHKQTTLYQKLTICYHSACTIANSSYSHRFFAVQK